MLRWHGITRQTVSIRQQERERKRDWQAKNEVIDIGWHND